MKECQIQKEEKTSFIEGLSNFKQEFSNRNFMKTMEFSMGGVEKGMDFVEQACGEEDVKNGENMEIYNDEVQVQVQELSIKYTSSQNQYNTLDNSNSITINQLHSFHLNG